MKNYSLFPKYIFRTPLLPFSQFVETFDGITAEETLLKLQDYFNVPVIGQALYVASPDLHATYQSWVKGELKDAERIKNLSFALLKYLSRMSSRCTPFGLFASVNIGGWGKESKIVLGDKTNHYQYTRLDMQYLCQLKNELTANKAIKEVILFYANYSIYTVGEELRYVEFNPAEKQQNYKISSVENSEYLTLIVDTVTANKGMQLKDIANLLVDEDISFEEAYEFIEELVANQLLVSELEPNVIGESYWDNMLATFKKYAKELPTTHELVQKLSILQEADNLLQKLPITIDTYHAVTKILEQFETPINPKYFLQVDLKGDIKDAALTFKIAGSVRKAMTILFQISKMKNQHHLNNFKNNFLAKYESKEIPLLEALDTEIGLGYGSNEVGSGHLAPLVDTVPVQHGKLKETSELKWGKPQDYYLKKYVDALKEQQYEIEIDDKDLTEKKEDWEKLSDSFFTLVQVLNDPSKEEPLLYLSNGGYGSAANMFGRFTHLNEEIETFTKSIAQHEIDINPDAILASISHLPKPRYGNFILRKQLYDYEIPLLTQIDPESPFQIPLDDLWVSVKNNRVILRSKKLNKEIVPRLSTAHNFSYDSVPFYHFLCDLEYQYKMGIPPFTWGSLKQKFSFLPRVRYQNVILHRATWQFVKNDLEELLKVKDDDLLEAMKTFRTKWKMPKLVYIVEADNELLFNLENVTFAKLFIKEAKKRGQVTIAECLFDTQNALVKDEKNQTYTNEIMLSFGKKTLNQYPALSPIKTEQETEIQRVFSPGSPWLYYKIYMGEQSTNEILLNHLLPFINHLQKENYIDQWFFIRYGDPKPHLRIRFHLTRPEAFQVILTNLNKILQPFLDSGIVWDIQLDTYKRELERYGKNNIPLFEQIFHYDSLTTCQALQTIEQTIDSQDFLMLYTLKSMDTYLSMVWDNLTDKKNFIEQMKKGYNHEFNANKHTNKAINKLYEKLLSFIERVETEPVLQEIWAMFETIIKERTEIVESQIKTIVHLDQEKQLHIPLTSGLESLLHMAINRLASTQQRKHELVFHNLLFRYYRMLISRKHVSFFDSKIDVV